jgi:hypothetical protein
MKIGDYVRTKNGNIRKIVELSNTKFIDDPDCYVDKVLINIEQNKIEDTIYMEKWLFDEEIIKSSPNIIDLIEVGDYINGHRVIDFMLENGKRKGIIVDADIWGFDIDEIKSIVTKEMYSSVEYKVESEVK